MRQCEFLQLHCRLGCGFAGLFVGLAIILKRWSRVGSAPSLAERMLAADFARKFGAQPARGRRGIHAGPVQRTVLGQRGHRVAERRAWAACSSAGLESS